MIIQLKKIHHIHILHILVEIFRKNGQRCIELGQIAQLFNRILYTPVIYLCHLPFAGNGVVNGHVGRKLAAHATFKVDGLECEHHGPVRLEIE
ncbi:hypothetical protein DSECCO2_604820 [anaerobic digester metagenome]